MTIRTEQTLRDMWEAGLKRRFEAEANSAEASRTRTAAETHDRAAASARSAAEAEQQAAASARTSADALFNLAEGRAAEAADLADLVNRERQAMGLTVLTPGEPYPEDPAPPPPTAPFDAVNADRLVVSQQSTVATSTDGQVAEQ